MKSLFVLFLLPFAAFAGMPNEGPPEEPPSWEQVLKVNQGVDVNTNTFVKTEAEASAEAAALAKVGDTTAIAKGGEGGQGGAGGEGGAGGSVGDTTASVGNTTATGGNVGDINVNGGGVVVEGDTIKYPRQAPPAYAPSVFPSSDKCDSGGFSIAFTSPVGGVSAGKGKGKPRKVPSDDCLFSLAQQFASGGQYNLWCRALMASGSAVYVFDDEGDKSICDNIRGPVPQGLAATQQPMIMVVPIAVPAGSGDPSPATREYVNEVAKRIIETVSSTPK